MEQALLLAIAFLLGFGASRIGLPPLVGYLIAGFTAHALGVGGGALINELADTGVTLLLFTIGLKLKLRSLARPEVWAGAIIHMLITVVAFAVIFFGLGMLNFSLFKGVDIPLAILIAFALSFSSTVFAVKVLEGRAEMASLHGRVSIGVLIVQDIIAVLFLTASAGKVPSPWALAVLPALFAIRPILYRMLNYCGHGELLILFGFFLALVVGAFGFELVGLKPDLGAIIIGLMMANHPKASELAKSLFSFKDLFLVGFFLTIGLSGLPNLEALGIAVLLVLAIPFKMALFFLLFTRFKLRSRTALLGSFSLANYSEFGLIVGAIAAANGWIQNDWLIIIAVALAISFILASPLNSAAHAIYHRFSSRLKPLETKTRHPDDQSLDTGGARIAVFGMGRIGTAVYEDMRKRYGAIVIGIDYNSDAVAKHQAAGRNVIAGDPTDFDFWERATARGKSSVRLALLTMQKHSANLEAAKQIVRVAKQSILEIQIAATAQFDDEVKALQAVGVQAAYNFYAEAGYGFAEHVGNRLDFDDQWRPKE